MRQGQGSDAGELVSPDVMRQWIRQAFGEQDTRGLGEASYDWSRHADPRRPKGGGK